MNLKIISLFLIALFPIFFFPTYGTQFDITTNSLIQNNENSDPVIPVPKIRYIHLNENIGIKVVGEDDSPNLQSNIVFVSLNESIIMMDKKDIENIILYIKASNEKHAILERIFDRNINKIQNFNQLYVHVINAYLYPFLILLFLYLF